MNRYVWIFPVNQFREFWSPLAKDIKSRTGFIPLLVVSSEEDKKFYIRQDGDCFTDATIVVASSFYREAMETDLSAWKHLADRARTYEDRFEITFNRSLVQADRHLGRDFIWGWHGYPTSYAQEKSNQAGRLKATVSRFDFFCKLFISHPPELIVGYGGFGSGISTGPVWHLCKENSVPFRSLASARFGGLHYWSIDPFNNPTTDFFTSQKNRGAPLSQGLKQINDLIKPPSSFQAVKRENPYPTLSRSLKIGYYQFAMRCYHKIKGYSKSLFGYKPVDAGIAPFIDWYNGRYFKSLNPTTLANIPKHLKVVAVPLQVEPEISIQGQSPNASNILNLIFETALSLPSDAIVIVKEHPLQVGRRPKWFYRLVSRMPNVQFLDPTVSGTELLAHTDLVVQINSSMGYQAAVQGIPVITFSPDGPITVLDHVTVVHSVQDLKQIMTYLASSDDKDVAEIRKRNGENFLISLYDCSDDLSWLYTRNASAKVASSKIALLVTSLLSTIEDL